MFTEQDSARQDAAFEALKEEFSRLEQQEKDLRKTVGLPEGGEVTLNESDMTTEVRQALEEAKAKAKREGAARRTQFESGMSMGGGSVSVPGTRRQGVVRA